MNVDGEQTYTVLVVDDEITVRQGLKTLIGRLRHWTWIGEAANGTDALELIQRLKPDLVLLDIRMPGMDGLKLLEALRAMNMDTLVVFLTGFPDFQYAQQAIRLGAFDYLLKPMRAQDIANMIEKARAKIAEMRSIQMQKEQYLRLSEQYRTWIEETSVREALYGSRNGWEERFDRTSIPFFRRSEVVLVATLQGDAHDERFVSAIGRPEWKERMEREFNLSAVVLQDGRNEWVFVLGGPGSLTRSWRPARLSVLFQQMMKDVKCVWRAGIGCLLPQDRIGLSYDQSKLSLVLANKNLRVVAYEEMPHVNGGALPPVELQFSLIKSVKRGDADAVEKLLANLESDLNCLPVSEACKWAVQLLAQLQDALPEFDDPHARKEDAPDLVMLSREEIVDHLRTTALSYANEARRRMAKQMNFVVQRVIDIVRTEFHSDLKLVEIASKLGINACYLSTLFKKETGCAFSEFLSRTRIEKSLTLLKNPEMKIYEVAQKVGYTDGRHFSQLFRKIMGMTPIEYRNRQAIAESLDECER
mgnify:CR=1 FL=1